MERVLHHFSLDPASRLVRLALGEKRIGFSEAPVRPWERPAEFVALNPAGLPPVLVERDGGETVVVAESRAILEHLEEAEPEPSLLGRSPAERAEARRLVAWFDRKFDFDVNALLLHEKMEKRLLGMGAPDLSALRRGREALRAHLVYLEGLLAERDWLAGARLSLGDFAAAANISVIDYFGDMPWRDFPLVQTWYMKLKSRPCFRPILADRWPGLAPPATMTTSISEAIRAQALGLGFDACGFASAADPWEAGDRLAEFVADGRHGEMGWMADTLERRAHPQAMWPGARSAIMLGVNYGPSFDPLTLLADRSRGAVSVYAHGEDYHEPIKKQLKALARWVQQTFGGEVKVFVDTAPLMEKPLAQRAGLGWQGKHTNLVSRGFGSWLFLGAILTSLDLPPDAASEAHCGQCSACLDVCPTNAFPAPFQLDARRCLAYLNNEHAGPFPPEFRSAMGNRVYGCDDCLSVCPWNKFAAAARDTRFHLRETLKSPALADLAALDDAAFRALFAKSPVKRIGRDRFLRNVLYAIGNSGDPGLMAAVAPNLADASPLVRGAAVWAASRLLDAQAFAALKPSGEVDPDVLAEWDYGAAASQASMADQAGGSVSMGAWPTSGTSA